ncbi:mechanosensitive ion channel domain-containing protein [Hamadaea sp. NPDC050747]|uniref:mechanosensitive ion channel family protein n=1 Tax=Hamadaea sp. NPDC050747 TaxID=3155789 RepID=UPI0033D27B32
MTALLLQFLADATPSPTPTVDCDGDSACMQFYDWFKNAKVAEASLWVIKPARIVLIVVLALILRAVLHRTITRMTERAGEGKIPTILRPLREKLPSALAEPTTLFPERRRQRAAAIGSVLRSFVTVTVFSIAGLMVLAELGINLTPLVAGLGIVGAALGFGAQSLVKDLIAGLFMLLEDQYGVGDTVDVGDVVGVVEAVGLRTITIRDGQGVVWYVRNGEIIRVGNKSQGHAVAIVDLPIGFAGVDEAVSVLRTALERFADDPAYADDFLEPPEVAGIESVTVDGATVRVIAKTTNDTHARVLRELRRRMTEALESSGIAATIAASRGLRQSTPSDAENGVRGPAPV